MAGVGVVVMGPFRRMVMGRMVMAGVGVVVMGPFRRVVMGVVVVTFVVSHLHPPIFRDIIYQTCGSRTPCPYIFGEIGGWTTWVQHRGRRGAVSKAAVGPLFEGPLLPSSHLPPCRGKVG